MEVTSLCNRLLMLEFILLGAQVQNSSTQKSDAAFLRITPNRLQHFDLDSISFDCGGSDGSTKLRVIRSGKEFDPECDIKRTPTGSSCTADRVYPSDSGEYWCETEGGERSNSVNITVTAGSVILESPALPVLEGDNVTLRCRNKTTSTNLKADFHKDDILMEGSPAEEMTINNISKSDEGLYKCSISGVGVSPGSWLAVRANTVSSNTFSSPHEEPHSNDSDAPRVLFLLWIAVTILMLALVLVVVGFLHIRKCRVSSKTPTAASHSDEDNQIVPEEEAADQNSVTYAVVVTKQRKDEDTADAGDNVSLCLETNHNRKPQTEKDEDESSFQPVYSALTISETPQTLQPESGLPSSTVTLNPTAAKDPSLTEQEVIYSPVQKATKSRDA